MSRTVPVLLRPLVGPRAPRRPVRTHSRRRAARGAVWTLPLAVLLIHAAAVCAIDVLWPRLRDPEYGRRADRLRARVAEHPNRPLVVVLGSSRVANGVRPGAWEESRPGTPGDPVLFNAAALGAGPVVQLIFVRRLYADGFRPDVVLLEYWPPVLRQDGGQAELLRRQLHRLRWADRPVLRDYAPAATERWMVTSRVNVLSENRTSLLAQLDSQWLPKPRQHDGAWAELDGWGWLPGMDPAPDDAATRHKLTEHQRKVFAPVLAGCTIHPHSDRALREAVAVARAHGARVGFIYLPESVEFQGRYPADLERAAREHLTTLSRELAVPVIDTRNWMDERYLADGFHLSRAGAARFTARLGPAVAAAFPPEARRDR